MIEIKEGMNVYDEEENEYIITKLLSEKGGFAKVYLAERKDTREFFAVKVIKDLQDDCTINSFKNEAEIAMQVKSKYAIRYFYYYNGEGKWKLPPYIIMEYASKGTLKDVLIQRIQEKNYFAKEEMIEIMLQLAKGMKDINEKVVHRDIKPENILCTDLGYKISDYGISKYSNAITRAQGETLKGYGSTLYYAPEAWSGASGKNTIQMDFYAMGIVFYQISTLCYPYKLEDDETIREKHLWGQVEDIRKYNCEVPGGIEKLIYSMLEKSPQERPATWQEVIDVLENNLTFNVSKMDLYAEELLKLDNQRGIAEKRQQTVKEKYNNQDRENYMIIMNQIISKVYKPLSEYVDSYNNKCGKIGLNLSKNCYDEKRYFEFSLELANGNNIFFKFEVIDERNFKSPSIMPLTSEVPIARNAIIPIQHMGRKILAWGQVYSDVGIGFNILLVKQDETLYGKLYVLKYNSQIQNAAFSFARTLSELYRENKNGFKNARYNIECIAYEFEQIDMLMRMCSMFEKNSIKERNYIRFR